MCEGWMGLIGALIGALIGGGITLFGQKWQYDRETKLQRTRDDGRRNLLRKMLDCKAFKGRTLKNMSIVIGAPPEETARLLIDIDARGLIGEKETWGYIKDYPLSKECTEAE